MEPEMKYPRWQRPLEAAILEFDPPLLRAKLANAENIISERFQELAADIETSRRHELLALAEGLTIVRILEKDRMLVLKGARISPHDLTVECDISARCCRLHSDGQP